MKKTCKTGKWFAITACLLFISIACYPTIQGEIEGDILVIQSTGNTLYVGGSGPGNYSIIQDAINDSDDGDTVYVYSGTYHDYIKIDRSVNLIGENKKTTVIDNTISGSSISISANWMKISGFTLKNTSIGLSRSNNNSIYNNDIIDGNIALSPLSSYNKIYDNIIQNGSIFLTGKKTTNNIIKNNIINAKKTGWVDELTAIKLYWYASNNIIEDNTINAYMYGIRLQSSSDNCIIKNNTINSNYRGISLGGHYNLVIDNYVDCNNCSIAVGTRNTIINNQLTGPISIGGQYESSYYHTIENNTLNGKPIFYYNSKENFTISDNAAQVIITNCSNARITNLTLEEKLVVAYSSNIRIDHNTVCNTAGIFLVGTYDSIIEYNTVKNNSAGIRLTASSDNTIRLNNIENNEKGIYFYFSPRATGVTSATNNVIEKNNFIDNEKDAPMEKRHLEDREDPPLPKNIWRNNYWGKSRVLPKVIWVYLFVGYLGNLMPLPFKTYYYYPTFDWNPAQQSYDTS